MAVISSVAIVLVTTLVFVTEHLHNPSHSFLEAPAVVIPSAYLLSTSSRKLNRGALDLTAQDHDQTQWSSATCNIGAWKVEAIGYLGMVSSMFENKCNAIHQCESYLILHFHTLIFTCLCLFFVGAVHPLKFAGLHPPQVGAIQQCLVAIRWLYWQEFI